MHVCACVRVLLNVFFSVCLCLQVLEEELISKHMKTIVEVSGGVQLHTQVGAYVNCTK